MGPLQSLFRLCLLHTITCVTSQLLAAAPGPARDAVPGQVSLPSTWLRSGAPRSSELDPFVRMPDVLRQERGSGAVQVGGQEGTRARAARGGAAGAGGQEDSVLTAPPCTLSWPPPWRSKALVTKDRLAELHAGDRARGLTEEQLQQLYVFHIDCECAPVSSLLLLPSHASCALIARASRAGFMPTGNWRALS